MKWILMVLVLAVLVPVASARNFTPREVTYLLTTAGLDIDTCQTDIATLEGYFTTAAEFLGSFTVTGGPAVMNISRAASAYAYGLDLAWYFTGGDAEKSYLLNISGSRPVDSVMTGDSRDRLISGTFSNYAANDASSQVQGVGVNVRNRSGGVWGTAKAGEWGYKNDSGATTTTAYGSTITVENYGTISGLVCGLLIDIRNEAAVATAEHGLWITNSNNSIAGPVAEAIYVDDSGANTGWTYGISFEDATIQTAEIIGSNGETIANTTDGYWDMSGTIRGTVDATGGIDTVYTVSATDVFTISGGVITGIASGGE